MAIQSSSIFSVSSHASLASHVLRSLLGIRHIPWTSSYYTLNDTKPGRRGWTEAEDCIIIRSRNDGKNIEETTALLPGRTWQAVKSRCTKVLNKTGRMANVKRRTPFSPAEDARILAGHPERLSWSRLLKEFPGRNVISLIRRRNRLRSNQAKHIHFGLAFTQEDDRVILEMRHDKMLSWSAIGKALERPSQSVQNRYYQITRPSQRSAIAPSKQKGLDVAGASKLKDLISQGLNHTQIARIMNHSVSKIWCLASDIEYEQAIPENVITRAESRCTAEEVERLIALRAEGMKCLEIAIELKRRPSHVLTKIRNLRDRNKIPGRRSQQQ